MARKVSKGWEGRLALHWFTYFGHVTKTTPTEADDVFDRTALREILFVQAHGNETRALALIEEIVRAPLQGYRLGMRYVQFWAWTEAGRPRRFAGSTWSVLEDCYLCIRQGARGAA